MLFLKFIKSKKLRLLLLVISLSLASGIYIGVSSGRDLARESYLNSITRSLGYTDFVIKGNHSYFFDYSSFSTNLTLNPYISDFDLRIQFWCRASYLKNFASYTYLYLTGLNGSIENEFGQLNIITGNSELEENNTIISSLVADLLDLNVNDSIFIQVKTLNGRYETIELNISGIAKLDRKVIDFDRENPDRYWSIDRTIFVNLSFLQKILGSDVYTHVYVHVNNLENITSAYKLMNKTLAPTFSICNIKIKMLGEVKVTVDNITKLIDVTYVMGFVLSVFILVDILYQYLLEWRYYIGVLKTLGATNTRIFLDLALTIFIVGVVGAIFGIPVAQLSFILVMYFTEPLIGFIPSNTSLFLSTSPSRVYEGFGITILLSMCICVLMLLAFLKKHTIITLLGREKRIQIKASRVWRATVLLLGVILAITGNYVLETSLPKELGAENLNVAFVGIISLMIGLAIALTPIIITLPEFLSKISFLSGKFTILATRNIKRNYWRSFFAIIIIAFTISFIIGGFAIFNSFHSAIETSSYLSVGSDISIDGSLPANLTSKILQVDGVTSATEIKLSWRQTFRAATKNISSVNVYGVNTTSFLDTLYEVRVEDPLNETDNPRSLISRLGSQNNTIILQKELLSFLNISVGDTVTWKTRIGDLNLTVIGTIDLMAGAWETLWKDYSVKSNIYMAVVNINLLFSVYGETEQYQKRVSKLFIKVDSGNNSTVVLQNIKAVLKENNVIPYRIKNVEEQIDSLMKYYTPFFGLFQILMFSFVLLSAFSIVTNFAYIALERRYEFAILKSLGFSSMDSIKLIVFESLLEAASAGILGIIIGVGAISHLFNILPYSPVFPLTYNIPFMAILASSIFVFALAILSSILPVYHLVKGEFIKHLRVIE